jgi:hypothetical protein
MDFKYQDDYDTLQESCPPFHYKSEDIDEVFRWVFDNILNPENFKSAFHKKPQRYLVKNDIEKCDALALSMFDNSSGAKERYHILLEKTPNLGKTLGTHLAKGSLSADDGVNGEREDYGHFNHHPSVAGNYYETFVVIERL